MNSKPSWDNPKPLSKLQLEVKLNPKLLAIGMAEAKAGGRSWDGHGTGANGRKGPSPHGSVAEK